MYCSNCGALIDADSVFCENCGTSVKNIATPENLNTSPQYSYPVQPPVGVQYTAAKPEPKYNPFVFISIGIMSAMILLCFLPWFTIYDKNFTLFQVFSESSYLRGFDMTVVEGCTIILLISVGFLIPSIILAGLKKNKAPVAFPIVASAIMIFNVLVFWIVVAESTRFVESTAVPFFMLALAVANCIFPIIARKVGK